MSLIHKEESFVTVPISEECVISTTLLSPPRSAEQLKRLLRSLYMNVNLWQKVHQKFFLHGVVGFVSIGCIKVRHSAQSSNQSNFDHCMCKYSLLRLHFAAWAGNHYYAEQAIHMNGFHGRTLRMDWLCFKGTKFRLSKTNRLKVMTIRKCWWDRDVSRGTSSESHGSCFI